MGYWWCGQCKEELPGTKVTYQERCEDCGSHVEWFDMTESPSERIAELEALISNLVNALGSVMDIALRDGWTREQAKRFEDAKAVYFRAKEVLGDEDK